MIKKLVYSYVIYYDNYTKDHKRDYKIWSKKSFLYGNDKKPIADTINFYATYHKATKDYGEDFYDYIFNSEDLDTVREFSPEHYSIYSFKPLTIDQLVEKFELFMAERIKLTVLNLQSIYSDIRKALEDNYGKEN